jgi:hypothetical protein
MCGVEMTDNEILEMSKQCGAMKHYFRDELLTFARLIEKQTREECARVCEARDIKGREVFAEAIRSHK